MGKGRRTRTRRCPYCKNTYVFTNWMVRKQTATRERDTNGRLLDDAHLVACARKHGKFRSGQ